MHLPELTTLALSEIQPYKNNPRRIPQSAIDAVASSIERFGYVQPIVVGPDHVIIVGHTRYAALQQLGHTQAEVYVVDLPEKKAAEYRLIDNRVSEMTSWDPNALVLELREFEEDLLAQFFADVDLEITTLTAGMQVSDKDLKDAERRIQQITAADKFSTHTTTVVCPHCGYEFEVKTKSLPGLTVEDLDALTG